MKVTKNQLKQLISEEIKNVLSEDRYKLAGMEDPTYGYGDYFSRGKTPPPADSTDKADDDQTKEMVSVDKKDVNEIYKLARALESNLPAGELQNKAIAIVDLVDKFRKET